MDIAQRIVSGEYREGDRLFGRSSLAGLYKVSPETIRRAIALLHSRGVVISLAGSGIVVQTAASAQRYLEESQLGSVLRALEDEVNGLLADRRAMDERLEQAIAKMVHYTAGTLSTMRHVEEFVVGPTSGLVGQTLSSADLRTRTGATVIGLARGREETFSPSPNVPLQPGDHLIVVGDATAKERLRALVEQSLGDGNS